MARSVFGIIKGPRLGESVIQQLVNAGFSPDALSFLQNHSLASQAILESLHQAGTITVTGIGHFVAAGPVLMALGSAASKNPSDVIPHALSNLGLRDEDSKKAASYLGNKEYSLIVIRTETTQEVDQARILFGRNNAVVIGASEELVFAKVR